MNASLPRIVLPAIRWLVISMLPVALPGCGKSSQDQTNSNASNSTAVKKSGGHGPVIDGEHFTTRVINDTVQKLPLCVFAAPEKWRDKSQVTWNYEYVSNPVWAAYSVENPANDEAMFGYPAARFFSVRPSYGLSRPGQNSLGLIEMERMAPAQAMLAYVRQARGRFPKLKLIGSKDLPGLPAALNVPQPQGKSGIGVKISYELEGRPVDEEFYAVYYTVDIPYDGPQGRSWQNNWGLDYLHSFRAPAGTLDKRRAVFAAIAKSFRPNPAWQERFTQINNYLQQQFNQQLQAGYDRIAAAGRLSRQISANNDAMLASIDRQLQASHTSGGGGGTAGRSSTDKFDDYIRGVETVDDPYYGTSQHSINEQYHWTDGYGNYRNSNDASYNPNQHENGDWQLMPQTR